MFGLFKKKKAPNFDFCQFLAENKMMFQDPLANEGKTVLCNNQRQPTVAISAQGWGENGDQEITVSVANGAPDYTLGRLFCANQDLFKDDSWGVISDGVLPFTLTVSAQNAKNILNVLKKHELASDGPRP